MNARTSSLPACCGAAFLSQAEREGLRRERTRHMETASAAAEQAQQVLQLRDAHADEVAGLRAAVALLEGASEDGRIIGRLQRQLSATKASYKAFVRKYEAALARARRKEASARRHEERVDLLTRALGALGEEKRLQVGSLKAALAHLTGRLLAGEQAVDLAKKAATEARKAAVGTSGLGIAGSPSPDAAASAAAAGALADDETLAALLRGPGTGAHHTEALRRQIEELFAANESAAADLAAAERRLVQSEQQLAAAEVHVVATKALKRAMVPLLEGNAAGGQAARETAQQIVALSDEARRLKLEALRHRTSLTKLREERRALEQALKARDARIVDLEEARIEAETEALLLKRPKPKTDREGSESDVEGLLPPDLSLSITRPLMDAVSTRTRALKTFHHPTADSLAEETNAEAAEAAEAARRAAEAQLKAAKESTEAKEAARAAAEREADRWREAAASAGRDAEALALDLKFYAKQAAGLGLPSPPSQAHLRASSAVPAVQSYFGGDAPTASAAAAAAQQQVLELGRAPGAGGLSASEVAELKRVSSTTIASLQTVIDEKNRMIEKYKARLAATRADMARGATTDKEAIEHLTNKMFRENEDAIGQLKSAAVALERAGAPPGGPASAGDVVGQLYSQLEQASAAARQREETVCHPKLVINYAPPPESCAKIFSHSRCCRTGRSP